MTLRECVDLCMKQFRLYEAHHLVESPPDTEKAATNAAFAKICEQTLAAERQRPTCSLEDLRSALASYMSGKFVYHDELERLVYNRAKLVSKLKEWGILEFVDLEGEP